MASITPFLVCFYWGGNVQYVNGEVTPDSDCELCTLFMDSHMGYEAFVDMVYVNIGANKETHRLSLYHYYKLSGIPKVSRIQGDSGLNVMYYLAAQEVGYVASFHVKFEAIEPTQRSSRTQDSQLALTSGAGLSTSLPETSTTGPSTKQFVPPMRHTGTSGAGPSRRFEGMPICGGLETYTDDEMSDWSTETEESEHDYEDDDSTEDEEEEAYFPPTEGGDNSWRNNLPDWADQDENIDMWTPSTHTLRRDMCFKGKAELIHAVRRWTVANGRELYVRKSDPHRWKAICYSQYCHETGRANGSVCTWKVHASNTNNWKLWRIYLWVDGHICYGTVRGNRNRSLTSNLIATEVLHIVRVNVTTPVKNIQAHITHVLNVQVSYPKAWRGRRKAIEMMYGTWASNFQELPSYIEALQTTNPDTVVEWKHHEEADVALPRTFKYVFWAFGPSINALRLCHPVIAVDGTHLKGTYRGKLLIAVTKNADNCILPVAYAIVDEETNESWSWFMEHLRWFVAHSFTKPICIISDRHRGIINAMEQLPDW